MPRQLVLVENMTSILRMWLAHLLALAGSALKLQPDSLASGELVGTSWWLQKKVCAINGQLLWLRVRLNDLVYKYICHSLPNNKGLGPYLFTMSVSCLVLINMDLL